MSLIGVTFLKIEWLDTQEQTLWKDEKWDVLKEGALFIENARRQGNNVVVHCAMGKSRSASLVIGRQLIFHI